MSSATIDRYLRAAKARDQIAGKSTTTPSPLLRSAIKIRKATDEVEASPGFFEGDTVAHCGPTLKGTAAPTKPSWMAGLDPAGCSPNSKINESTVAATSGAMC